MFLLEQIYGVVLNDNSNLSEFVVLFSNFYLFCQSIYKNILVLVKSESSDIPMEPNYFDS